MDEAGIKEHRHASTAKKMSLLAETSIGHGLLGYCDVIACACISYYTTKQSRRKPGSKFYGLVHADLQSLHCWRSPAVSLWARVGLMPLPK